MQSTISIKNNASKTPLNMGSFFFLPVRLKKKNVALSEKDRCALSLRPPLACGVPATKLRVRWKCENQEQIRVWCTSETDLNRQAATYYIIYQEAAAQE
jgi:hypothetical protein